MSQSRIPCCAAPKVSVCPTTSLDQWIWIFRRPADMVSTSSMNCATTLPGVDSAEKWVWMRNVVWPSARAGPPIAIPAVTAATARVPSLLPLLFMIAPPLGEAWLV